MAVAAQGSRYAWSRRRQLGRERLRGKHPDNIQNEEDAVASQGLERCLEHR